MLPWKLRKRQSLPDNQNLSSGIFVTCEVSACELQPFSCHDLANDIYSLYTLKLPKQCSATLTYRLRLILLYKKVQYDWHSMGQSALEDKGAGIARILIVK